MNRFFLIALIPYAALTFADSSTNTGAMKIQDSPNSIIEEDYEYSTDLDIARVRSVDDVSNVCGIVPVKMRYDDSDGKTHILRYLMMGAGCGSN
nr:DUF2790 domain-containing protein [uncultured Pseudomonas sp.]